MARTSTTGSPPEFMTSPILAGFLTAELALHIEAVEKELAEHDQSRLHASRVRSLRGAMAQLDAYHAASED